MLHQGGGEKIHTLEIGRHVQMVKSDPEAQIKSWQFWTKIHNSKTRAPKVPNIYQQLSEVMKHLFGIQR
jgi:hypothetical protein